MENPQKDHRIGPGNVKYLVGKNHGEKPGLVSLVGISLCMTDVTSSNLESLANIQSAGGVVPVALAETELIRVEVICNVTLLPSL